MSIESQIEAAWKARCGENITHPPGAEWIYRQGYMDAMRGLWHEVKPEDCAEYGVYWIEVDDDYWEATFRKDKTGDYFDIKDIVSNSEVEIECVGKVYQMVLPSPSDIFGIKSN